MRTNPARSSTRHDGRFSGLTSTMIADDSGSSCQLRATKAAIVAEPMPRFVSSTSPMR